VASSWFSFVKKLGFLKVSNIRFLDSVTCRFACTLNFYGVRCLKFSKEPQERREIRTFGSREEKNIKITNEVRLRNWSRGIFIKCW